MYYLSKNMSQKRVSHKRELFDLCIQKITAFHTFVPEINQNM